MKHSHSPSVPGQVFAPKLPANPSAELLLGQWAKWRASKILVMTQEITSPPWLTVLFAGANCYSVVLKAQGEQHADKVSGLSEADAHARAELLAKPTAPTGYHLWN